MKRNCPICSNNAPTNLLTLELTSNGLPRFQHQIDCCKYCGFIYNSAICHETVDNLYKSNINYSIENAAGSGGSNATDLFRYGLYIELLGDHGLSKNVRLVDVGCAKGGFVRYLKEEGFEEAVGMEIDPALVEIALENGLSVINGAIDCFPYEDETISCITASHVLEHVIDIKSAIAEIYRVLELGGQCLIEVPNAARYIDGNMFPHFWTCIKEHINHFDKASLAHVFKEHGFRVLQVVERNIPYEQQEYSYPSLLILFQKQDAITCRTTDEEFGTSHAISAYIALSNAQLKSIRKKILILQESQAPVAIWGCSHELQVLVSFTKISECNIVALVDKNSVKHGAEIMGTTVESPHKLSSVASDCRVIVCSIFHEKSICADLHSIAPGLKTVSIQENAICCKGVA